VPLARQRTATTVRRRFANHFFIGIPPPIGHSNARLLAL
jgi:hypothetical protein